MSVRLFALLALIGLAIAPAQAADYGEPPAAHHGAETPDCADPKVAHRIQSKFRHQARNVLHRPDLAIVAITGIHQKRYEGRDVYSDLVSVPRRYCQGTAMLSDGHHRTVWYLIEGGAGFASIGANVAFCVSGFDRWNVYNSHCRVLR